MSRTGRTSIDPVVVQGRLEHRDANLGHPGDVDQRSELMSITIPK